MIDNILTFSSQFIKEGLTKSDFREILVVVVELTTDVDKSNNGVSNVDREFETEEG